MKLEKVVDENFYQIHKAVSERRQCKLPHNKLYYHLIVLALKDSMRYTKKHTDNKTISAAANAANKNKLFQQNYHREEARKWLSGRVAKHVWEAYLNGHDYQILRERLEILWERLDGIKKLDERIKMGTSLRLRLGRLESK